MTNETHFYCASEGRSLREMLVAAVQGARALPDWPQLRRNTVIGTYMGRTAVWQLCQIWGLGEGDEVLIPAYNCGTEVDPLIKAKVTPVLYRVDREVWIDTEDIRRRTTHRTRAIFVIHYFGWPQPIGELARWCHEKDIRLVEDCAQSLFAEGPDGPLGTQGDAAKHRSLRKFLPVPDGGIWTSKNNVIKPQLRGPSLARTSRALLPRTQKPILARY